jgi:cytochrome c peroxidase
MKNKRYWLFSIAFAVICLFCGFAARQSNEPVTLDYPKNWPAPQYDFSKNPLTRAGIALGRELFYNPILSRDSTVSCANCHLSFTAFTHVDHALSHGIQDRVGYRNSLALTNLAWAPYFMWDGAVSHLDFQALAPISDSTEMDENIEHVIKKINRSTFLRGQFYRAFGDSTATGERLLKAISQFELTLITANSKYDRVLSGRDTFSLQEENGYALFKKNCASCHAEPFFTNFKFEKNGLPLDTLLRDYGRMRVTGQRTDSLAFKVPSLRNIEFSQPYMHDGRFRKLREVVNFYSTTAQTGQPIILTPNEKVDLVAFLLTLTDKQFLFNPDLSFPKR